MIQTKIYHPASRPSTAEKEEIINFLYHHLDEYGDKKEDIEKAIDYSLQNNQSPGGFVMVKKDDNKDIAAAVVVNKTGMTGYIPDNILVYIATNKDQRGKGVGKSLMNEAIDYAEGDIALHVEPDNPAKKLYEKLGFTNKYLEMRLKKGA